MTVREMLSRMTSAEYAEWMAYYRIDPWGRERRDYMLAQIAATIYGMWRSKQSPARTIADYMPVKPAAHAVRAQSAADMRLALKAAEKTVTRE